MLSINISELVLTAVNFFLLFFLLRHFLYAPLISFMDQRRARIEEGLDQEKQALAAVQANELLLEAKRKESMDQAKSIVDQAQRGDEQRREKLMEQAWNDAAQARDRAKAQVRDLRETETEKLKAGEAELAALLADRLLDSGYGVGK